MLHVSLHGVCLSGVTAADWLTKAYVYLAGSTTGLSVPVNVSICASLFRTFPAAGMWRLNDDLLAPVCVEAQFSNDAEGTVAVQLTGLVTGAYTVQVRTV